MKRTMKTVGMALALVGVSPFAGTCMVHAAGTQNVVVGVKNAAQQAECKGTVKDSNGEAVIGASVVVKGATTGDNASDNFVPSSPSSYLFNTLSLPSSASSSNGWYWNDIRSCNYFLQRYSTFPGSEAEVNRYVAEDFRLDDLKRWNAMKLLENPKTMFNLKITPSVIKEYGDANVTFVGEDGRPVIEYKGDTYLYQ